MCKAGSNSPTGLLSTQPKAERDSRRTKDPTQGRQRPMRGCQCKVQGRTTPTPVQMAERRPYRRTRRHGSDASPCHRAPGRMPQREPLCLLHLPRSNSKPEAVFYGVATLFPAPPPPSGISAPFSRLSPPSHAKASRRWIFNSRKSLHHQHLTSQCRIAMSIDVRSAVARFLGRYGWPCDNRNNLSTYSTQLCIISTTYH